MANQADRAGYRRVLKLYPPSKLALALDITRQAVHQFDEMIPERFLMRVSYLTGLPPEKITPSVVREWVSLKPKERL